MALVALGLGACASTTTRSQSGASEEASGRMSRTRVIVLGTIHGQHRTSERYSIAILTAALRSIKPDSVLCEIPPDRLDVARRQFETTGKIDEPRVRVFPEYVDVLFPLTKETTFEIVPCAGWTKAMSDERSRKLTEWTTTRPDETAEVEAAQKNADEAIARESQALGMTPDDPMFIHTPRFDELTKAGLEPYDRLFNADLGPGGWTNINTSHYALISKALDERKGQGKTVVVIFGAGHKYWFLEKLRERGDVELVDARGWFRKP